MSYFSFWCPLVRSCVACPVPYVARLVAVIVVFLWYRRVCTLAVLLVPCFLYPVWGSVFGVWVWFCLVCWGVSGVVLLPCGRVYPSVCALLLGRVCLGRDGVFVGASGYCVVLWCLFWCVWFVVYMLCVVFSVSALSCI